MNGRPRWLPTLARHPSWPTPDYLAPTRRHSRLAWLSVVVSAATLLVCGLDSAALRREQQDAERQLERWQRASLAQRPVATAATSVADTAAAAGADSRASSQALRSWPGALQYPWPWLFGGLESVSAGAGEGAVRWLALEHDRERGDVRLEGIGASAGAVLTLVDALAGEAGWTNVVLVRLAEHQRTEAGADGVRFEISAQLGAVVPGVGR